jgi:hypothetical protein
MKSSTHVITFILILLSNVACAAENPPLKANAAEVESAAARGLVSSDPKVILEAYALLRGRTHLTAATLRLVIESFHIPTTNERLRGTGPDTTANLASAILIGNSERSASLLRAALKSADWNVRRYAAFTLGEMCERNSAGALRLALQHELPLAKHSRLTGTGGQGTAANVPMLATADAILRAYARIDLTAAVRFLLGLFRAGHEFENYYANHGLRLLAPEATVLGPAEAPDWWNDSYRPDWNTWWTNNRAGIREECKKD